MSEQSSNVLQDGSAVLQNDTDRKPVHVETEIQSENVIKTEDDSEVKHNVEDGESYSESKYQIMSSNATEVKVVVEEKDEVKQETVAMESDVPLTQVEIKDIKKVPDVIKMEDSLAYRGDGTDGSDDEGTSDDSDDSSSSSSDTELENKKEMFSDRDDDDEDDKPGKKKKGVNGIRTRGEMYPEELPPLEDLKISVDEAVEMQQIGTVSSVVGVLVVIQASKDLPALNEETVLFTEKREAFGKIFEVFGPVVSPFYSVRFNSPDDIVSKNITVGLPLYCAPKEQEYTQFVFVEQLKRIKGSDASWENNNEPPVSCLDFSDDEDEKKMKSKNRNRPPVDGATDEQNKKGRNRQKKPRSENGGNNQEHCQDQMNPGSHRGGRDRHQWPPRQMDSWPPRESNPWQSPTPFSNGDWQTGCRSYGSHPQQSQSFISPSSFHGNRGQRQRFQNPYQQTGGPSSHPSFRERSFQGGFMQGQDYNSCNSGMLMDTRHIQNPNHNGDAPPFGMTRQPHPRSTFGGQPRFNPGPVIGQYNARPGMSGQHTSGPPGRW